MTTNLLWSEVASNQNDKEATMNTQRGQFDAALTELYSIAGDTSPTLTLKEFNELMTIQTDGAQTDDVTITLPATKKLFTVDNSASSYAALIVMGDSTQVVRAGINMVLATDGTTDGLVALSGNLDAAVYESTAYESDISTANKNVLFEILPVAGDIPVGATGSQAYADVASSGNYTYDLKKNGVSFGSLTFNTGVKTGSFTVASLTSFSVGDRLTIEASGTPDSTLKQISFSIVLE